MAELVGQVLRRPRLAAGCAPAVLGRLRHLAGSLAARDASLCEVMSYLFFDPDFIEAAIEAGQRDARAAACDLERSDDRVVGHRTDDP